jgi:hypothetical protein
MERIIPRRVVTKLERKALLPVDPSRSIAIKRDVHEFIVEADCDAFADAFKKVMTDPEGSFGLIRVKRPESRMGRDFGVGERFQGCYSIEGALLKSFSQGWRRALRPMVAWVLRRSSVRWTLSRIEDALMSDYAIIAELVLDPDRSRGQIHTLKYCYLEGTPIAGSSRFSIESLGPGRCRVTQIFEYQEVNGIALATFQRFGLKMHDQVVHMQIAKAAERCGAPAPVGTIPLAYAQA